MASTPATPLTPSASHSSSIPNPNAPQYVPTYAFRAQKSLNVVGAFNGGQDYVSIPGGTLSNGVIGGEEGSPEVKVGCGFAGLENAGVNATAKTMVWSADGRLYAYALPSCVRVFAFEDADGGEEGAKLLVELPIKNAVEMRFSPKGTYLSTWERPIKLEDGAQYKNFRVWKVPSATTLNGDVGGADAGADTDDSGELTPVAAFTQKSLDGWDVQYTSDESRAVRLVSGEIQVYHPAEFAKGIFDKTKVEGASYISLSPGNNPSVAVFVAEKKGAPASFKIYPLHTLAGSPSPPPPPTCQKTFYKADRCSVKWNGLGTQVLLHTQTDVDQNNKNYYGESGMYLLSSTGNFDCRVQLDREGPIYDFAWNPSGKEFGIVYGYMPAKAMLFDQKVRPVHDFGSSPVNFVSFNPSGRLLALAGFGNLAGNLSIYDRRTLQKLSTISAPNSSLCKWSPCGRYLLTAILSPRLRVDNGVKVWFCTGDLMHEKEIDECYQVAWRPALVERIQAFPQKVPQQPPIASVEVRTAGEKQGGGVNGEEGGVNGSGGEGEGGGSAPGTPLRKPQAVKPLGAYRPPGARGLATPTIYLREDEGGMARTPSGLTSQSTQSATPSGQNTPSRGYSRSPAPGQHGHGQNGHHHGGYGHRQSVRGRYVPGAMPREVPGSGGPGGQGGGEGGQGDKKRRRKKKGDGEEGPEEGQPNGERKQNQNQGQGQGQGQGQKKKNKGKGQGQGQGGKDGAANGTSTPSGEAPTSPSPAAAAGGGGAPANPPGIVKIDTSVGGGLKVETALEPVTPGLESALDPVQKKARNLNKKLKAIEELKEKHKRGERLEATQLKKMEGEAEIRKELKALGDTAAAA